MKLIWTEPAVAYVQAIHDYIAFDSLRYAEQYRIDGDALFVLTVVHGRRDLGNEDVKPWEVA